VAATEILTGQIKDGTIARSDLNASTTGEAVIRKIVAGTLINIGSTGVDAGTGDVTVNVTQTGNRSFFVPAAAMWPSTTSGCTAIAKAETSTNKQNLQTLAFNDTSKQYAEFTVTMPDNWDGSTVTFKVVWTTAATSGNCIWELAARAYGDGNAIDGAWGSAVAITDTAQATANSVLDTGESGALTIANSPSAGKTIQFRIDRDAANGSDTMAGDALLIGARIKYGISQFSH
jgi:hypothetical protein